MSGLKVKVRRRYWVRGSDSGFWTWECPSCAGCGDMMAVAVDHSRTCPALQRDRIIADLRSLTIELSHRSTPYILSQSAEQQNPSNSDWTEGYFRGLGSGLSDARYMVDQLIDHHAPAVSQ